MTLVGKIAEYLDNGKFICGHITGGNDKRYQLLNQNGREAALSGSRIIHSTTDSLPLETPRDEVLRKLKETDELRRSWMESVNLNEIWELTADEPSQIFTPRFLAELCFGSETDDNRVAAFLRCILGDAIYFKYKSGNVIVHPPEIVEQLLHKKEVERQLQRLLESGAAALQKIWQGQVPTEWPEQECFKILKDYYLFGNEAEESQTAKELLKKAQLTAPHDAYRLLVKAGVWNKNENIPLLRNGLPTDFSDAILSHCDSLDGSIDVQALLAAGYTDLRHLPLLTIDGAATRDFDDALHVEKHGDNFLVGIHITDVGQVVKPGTPLFDEALKRASTLYFPEGVIPMLPKSISENHCSMIAGEIRAALSCMVVLSPEGEILQHSLKPSIVIVKRQLSYFEANRTIETDEELSILFTLSNKLRDRRLANGAVLLPLPEIIIHLNDGENVDITLGDTETPGRVLVSEMMVLANYLGAGYIADREAPGLFRSQPPPRQRIIHGLDKDIYTNIRQRKQLSPMLISTSPAPHSGIGAPCYTTVTSPIRRFADLIMQQQIIHLALGKGILYSLKEMKNLTAQTKQALTKLNGVKHLRQRYWLLKYLEAHREKSFKALIIERTPHRVHVLLTDLLLDSDLPPNQSQARPGDTVMVNIAKVDALGNILRLSW